MIVHDVQGPALTIGRTTYQVRLVVEAVEADNEVKIRAYLTGPRGATYVLLPNENNPSLCFPVAERVGRRLGGALDGMWFRLKYDTAGMPVAVEVAR